MKKFILLLTVIITAFTLVACGDSEFTITVAASPTPHAEILELAKPLLKEKGYKLKIKKYSDYVTPNQALTKDQVDANFFQHGPYLEKYNKDYNTNILNVAKIHIEPIGIYAPKEKGYKSLADVQDGDTVLLSSSKADHGRLISLLAEAKLLIFDEDFDINKATLEDIKPKNNPKNLIFKATILPELLTNAYERNQGDLILINSNFALDAGLSPGKDAIALESADGNPFSNIIATTEKYVNSDKIKAFVEVLLSDEIKQAILNKWNGDIVPA